MDVNACLARIIDAALGGDCEELCDAVDDFCRWVGKGGALPDDPRKLDEIHYTRGIGSGATHRRVEGS